MMQGFVFFVLELLVIALISRIQPFKAENVDTECAKQCACTEEHISDLPMMKWLNIPSSSTDIQNELITDNRVLQDNEEEILLDSNLLIRAASCVFQGDSHQIIRENFYPNIEALTILYGRDMFNKTIEHELSDFQDLLVLDIQGYKKNINLTDDFCNISLQHTALLQLHNLRYLNIENILLFANPNSVTEELTIDTSDSATHNQLEQRKYIIEERHPNITILIDDEPEIIPYNEYKKQKTFVSTFSHLSNLRFLRLFRCRLKTITWEMFKDLSDLQTLSLEGNALIEIPRLVFYLMTNLKTLILSDNKLMHIYLESLAGLFRLEHLDLSKNNFHYLSDSTFAPLSNLRYLNLNDNPLETIYSNTFEVMIMIQHLIISSRVPLIIHKYAFNGINYIEKLIIVGINAEILDNSLLAGMSKLKYLDIKGKIEYIDFDTFANSPELEVLLLNNCSLKLISIDAFYGLFNLKKLDLSRNELETLPPGVFNHLHSLKELILTHNKFVTLIDVLSKLQYVKMIRLEENPWNCSCEMALWRHLNINVVKKKRIVDLPCGYKYDKNPCTETEEEMFIHSEKVLPICTTPTEFEGLDLLHVVNKKLRCRKKPQKHTYATYSRPLLMKKGRKFENNEPEKVTEYSLVTNENKFSTTRRGYLSVSTRITTSSETQTVDKFENKYITEPKELSKNVNNQFNDLF